MNQRAARLRPWTRELDGAIYAVDDPPAPIRTRLPALLTEYRIVRALLSQ